MRKWTIVIVVTAFWCWLFLPEAQAGLTRPGSFSLFLGGGYHFFEGNQNLEDKPSFSLALGYNFANGWGTEGTFRFVDTESDSGSNTDAKVYNLQLDILYHFSFQKKLAPYLAFGVGVCSTDLDPGSSDEDLLANYGIGLKYFVNNSFALRGDIRHLVIINASDMDRTRDVFHNLSSTAGLSFSFGGGGEPISGIDEFLELPNPIVERLDGGPGMGVTQVTDSDRDGVPDLWDQCPDTPERGLVHDNGCRPDPEEPFYLPLNPKFEEGMFIISEWDQRESVPVANFILNNPGRQFVIEVHTDNQGPAAYNRYFTQRQADNLHRYLVDHFDLPAHRIEAKGYGDQRPIATNANPEGREQNRRVVLFASADTSVAAPPKMVLEDELLKNTASRIEGPAILDETIKNIMEGF